MITEKISHCLDTLLFWTAECDGRYRARIGNARAMCNGKSVPVHRNMKMYAVRSFNRSTGLRWAVCCILRPFYTRETNPWHLWLLDLAGLKAVWALWEEQCLLFIASRVGLSLFYWGHLWPILPAPGDRWGWLWSIWWNEDWQGKPKYSKKTSPSATLSTTNPTWPDPGSNPGAAHEQCLSFAESRIPSTLFRV
jgi:hypothetical protein